MKKGLNDVEKFCLAGYHVTKNADMAYKLSRKRDTASTPENAHRLALRWVRSKDAVKYLQGLSALSLKQVEGEDERDKTDIVRELNALASSTHDPKLRTEILMKLADLQKMKEDRSETEGDGLIHYYLPVNYPTDCRSCLLNPKNKERGKE